MRSTSLDTCCTRSEIAQPGCGSSDSVLKISRSSVPCGRSMRSAVNGVPFHFYRSMTATLVEVQGERSDDLPLPPAPASTRPPASPILNNDHVRHQPDPDSPSRRLHQTTPRPVHCQ